MDDNHERIDVECPVCHCKATQEKARLRLFAYACPDCKCVFKHALMREKELEDAKKN